MKNHPEEEAMLKAMTRRHFFQQAGYGIGATALAALLNDGVFPAAAGADQHGTAANPRSKLELSADPLAPRAPHFAPKAKNIIYLFMAGAPSQIDLLDPKPKLVQYNGQAIPEEFIKGERFAFIKGTPRLLGSPHTFTPQGKSGIPISALLPHLGKIADDICVVRSLYTEQFNHAPAQIFLNSGTQLIGRPSMGSWLTYGLGSANRDLPGFVVLLSGDRNPDGGKSCWGSGFLPTVYQGVEFRNQGDPVLFVSNPEGMDAEVRRQSLDALRDLNHDHLNDVGDPEIATRIAAYELAYRMQTSVPDLMDTSKEPQAVQDLYGTTPGKTSFANNCLLARRLVERGTRFVQLYHRGWDHHGEAQFDDLTTGLGRLCKETDQAASALIQDLKQRGLLDTTLVVWGGEFGRTPMNEERGGSKFLGRDHHPKAFSIWMAGGGIKGGTIVGGTDELGYNVVVDPVHVHDLHATMLHQMGLDHTRLTYKFQGRNFRLTDVSGTVIKKMLA